MREEGERKGKGREREKKKKERERGKEKRGERREERGLRCVSRLTEGTYLAILVQRYGLTHPPPTIHDSQPDHHQNVLYSTGKSDDEPTQSE